jgi:hypothetical protein
VWYAYNAIGYKGIPPDPTLNWVSTSRCLGQSYPTNLVQLQLPCHSVREYSGHKQGRELSGCHPGQFIHQFIVGGRQSLINSCIISTLVGAWKFMELSLYNMEFLDVQVGLSFTEKSIL